MPDPTRAMTENFRFSLDSLVVGVRREVIEAVLERPEEAIFEHDLSGLAQARSESSIDGVPAPGQPLTGSVTSPEELGDAIESANRRWRLDAVLAFDDYLS